MGRELHVHSHPSRVEHWRHLIEIVALTIAAAWGFYVFIYQEKIKPATAPPDLLRTVTVDTRVLKSGKEFVKVNIEMKNVGESTVQLSAIIANLYGIRFADRSGKQVTKPLGGIDLLNFGLKTSARKPLFSFYDTWKAVGSPKGGNIPIDPGQTWSESFVVGIRPGEYDVGNIALLYCYSHVTNRVWPGREIYQADGTAWLQLPANYENEGLHCPYQRAGLNYPL